MNSKITILAIAISAFSCGKSTDNTTASETTADQPVEQNEPVQVDSPNQDILEHYISLKNALVESDAAAAAKAAAALATAPEVTDNIASSADAIALSSDLAVQRDEFYNLSQELYVVLKSDTSLNQTVYWQYCPMARNDEGANWLSVESEIRNPYFGDAMLTCGMVEEEI